MPRSEPIKGVRGMRDILPDELPLWRAAETAATEVAHRFGYEEIVTPIIEHAELIERVGEDTDAVAKELYRFEDRGGRHLALRPEATAGVVRAYFEGGLNQGPQPSRLYLLGPMFRYDRPQKGRYRQFFQLDVEAIGSANAALIPSRSDGPAKVSLVRVVPDSNVVAAEPREMPAGRRYPEVICADAGHAHSENAKHAKATCLITYSLRIAPRATVSFNLNRREAMMSTWKSEACAESEQWR